MPKLIKSFSFALNGLKICAFRGANFKIHLFFTMMAILLGFFLNISNTEWIIILLCIAFVLCMEMMNTAVEQLCDVIHREYHHGIKIVKDVAAGAVLLSAIVAAICGAFIFFPKILSFIQSM